MNVVIVGQGAIGLLCYVNAHNTPLLDDTHVLASNLAYVQKYQYLNFTALTGSKGCIPLKFADDKTLAHADVVVVCVKSYQLADTLKSINAKLHPDAAIICSHNGVVSKQCLIQAVGKNRNILLMLTTHGSKKTADNEITHTGAGRTDIGLLSGSLDEHKVQSFKALAEVLLPNALWQQDIEKLQWLKLAVNAVINPLTAIHNIDNGQVLNEQYQTIKENVLKELVQVAKQNGIQFSIDELKMTVDEVATKTASNCSSMRTDVLNQRATEIDTINGFIVEQGNQLGIETTENQKLWQAVKDMETSGKNTAG